MTIIYNVDLSSC